MVFYIQSTKYHIMRSFIFVLLLSVLMSCDDNLTDPFAYRDLSSGQIQASLNYQNEYPISYTLIAGTDTIAVDDTLTYSVIVDTVYIVDVDNTTSIAQEVNYNETLSVVASQHGLARFSYSNIAGRITNDSTFISDLDTVAVTLEQIDSIYTELGFTFTEPVKTWHFYNFNLNIPIEDRSFDVFSGAVQTQSLIFHGVNTPPVIRQSFNRYRSVVVFDNLFQERDEFQRKINETLTTRLTVSLE